MSGHINGAATNGRGSPNSPRRPYGDAMLLLGLVLFAVLLPGHVQCADKPDIQSQGGGHLRTIGTISWLDDASIYSLSDQDSPFYDGQAELRLKNQLFLGSRWRLETHYEAVLLRGDTREADSQLRARLPANSIDLFIHSPTVNDDRRLMNLTHTIDDGNDQLFYHRLDRLNVTYAGPRGTVRVGRQAITWGNGLIFNPMDLFNPFAPTTVKRDYKMGEDMVFLQLPVRDAEAQFLYVPRRDLESGQIEPDQSSYAGKWHFSIQSIEVDAMAAHHYGDAIWGIGFIGNLGGAVWRLDTLYTFLEADTERDGFWQVVANIDYAWQWGGKNIYGLLEYFYNGVGRDDDYIQALSDPLISERLQRGELFTLGRNYLAGQIQAEFHPLLQLRLASIANLADGSGIFQPQMAWDVSTDWQLILGANLHWGGADTEYGGYETQMGPAPIKIAPADSVYLWLTYYF